MFFKLTTVTLYNMSFKNIEQTAMNQTLNTPASKGFSGKQVFLFVIAAILVTILITYFVVRTYIFPSEFKPVTLSEKEEQGLNEKLAELDILQNSGSDGKVEISGNVVENVDGKLQPEAYTEAGASREISFNERELNALVASNTDMAKRLAVDLSDDLASAKLLIPLDPDFPIMGGKTLRLNAGVQLAFNNNRPVVVLKGVSVMGVPIPNAWLGNLKNVDLVSEFGSSEGFWKAFAAGVELIEVKEGRLLIRLKE